KQGCKPRAQKCAAGTRWAVCMGSMRARLRDAFLAERSQPLFWLDETKDHLTIRVVPAKAGTHDHRQWLWGPARAALGRDDDDLVQAKHHPVDARNDRRPRSIVSGLLFTMTFATRTCRSHERSNSLHGDCDGDNGEASAAFAHPGGGEAADQE